MRGQNPRGPPDPHLESQDTCGMENKWSPLWSNPRKTYTRASQEPADMARAWGCVHIATDQGWGLGHDFSTSC